MLSLDQIRRVADLARLELSATEIVAMQQELNGILELVDQMAAVDTEGGAAKNVRLDRSEGYGDVESWGPPRWRVYVEGPRGGGYAEFALDGKRKRVMRW